MAIVLVGDPSDLTCVYIGWLAEKRGLEVMALPEASLGIDWNFRIVNGRVEIESRPRTLAGEECSGVFVRLNPQPEVSESLDLAGSEASVYLFERRSGMQQLIGSLPCAAVNRSTSGMSNASKPYQMRELGRLGLNPPRWIISNEVDVVEEFVRSCKDGAIYKAISGLRSEVRRVSGELMERIREGTSPVLIQAYVPGREVRVHLVRGTSFPTEIFSNEIDYRFKTDQNAFAPTTIPSDVEDRCLDAAKWEDLELSGFDFRIASDGTWHCLEMNPVPSFLPYEMATGQRIGDAVLDLLCS